MKIDNKIIWVAICYLCFLGCEEPETPTKVWKTVFNYNNIEEDKISDGQRYTDTITGLEYTGWGVYEDIIFPGTSIEWAMNKVNTPALDGEVLACSITGGDQYNNVFFTNTVALKWNEHTWPYEKAKKLVYELDFYVDGKIDCQNPNNSELEGIEFTWQHILIPVSNGFGVQWSKGGEWRYWNDEKDLSTNKAKGWESFANPINTCIEAYQWHHLVLEGLIIEDGIQYTNLNIDGVLYDISEVELSTAYVPDNWVENFLQIGMQINGNKATNLSHGHGVDPVSVYLDKVRFEGLE